MKKKNRLAQGIRCYIRRQKMVINRMAKDNDQKNRLIQELLDRFYGEGTEDVKEKTARQA